MSNINDKDFNKTPLSGAGGLQTPSQTVGPFFAYSLTPQQYQYDFKQIIDNQMVDVISEPNAITIVGKLFDGEKVVIPDAIIEIWDAKNQLFGRFGTGTDVEKRFIFHTIKPASIDGQAPYLSVIIFMRGQLIHSYTRIYFSDEKILNQQDETLNFVPTDRKHTLIASRRDNFYEFNIYMQGENETIFFDI